MSSQNSRVEISVNGRKFKDKSFPENGKISGLSQVCCLGRERPMESVTAHIIAAIRTNSLTVYKILTLSLSNCPLSCAVAWSPLTLPVLSCALCAQVNTDPEEEKPGAVPSPFVLSFCHFLRMLIHGWWDPQIIQRKVLL